MKKLSLEKLRREINNTIGANIPTSNNTQETAYQPNYLLEQCLDVLNGTVPHENMLDYEDFKGTYKEFVNSVGNAVMSDKSDSLTHICITWNIWNNCKQFHSPNDVDVMNIHEKKIMGLQVTIKAD